MEILKGTLHHMTRRISDKRQEYIAERGDNIVPKGKTILGTHFTRQFLWKLSNYFEETSMWSLRKKVPH